MTKGPAMKGGWGLRLGLPVLAGILAAAGAGYVLDGAGKPAIGFWAIVWGLATFLVVGAVSMMLPARPSTVRRLAKGLLALVLGAVSAAVL